MVKIKNSVQKLNALGVYKLTLAIPELTFKLTQAPQQIP